LKQGFKRPKAIAGFLPISRKFMILQLSFLQERDRHGEVSAFHNDGKSTMNEDAFPIEHGVFQPVMLVFSGLSQTDLFFSR